MIKKPELNGLWKARESWIDTGTKRPTFEIEPEKWHRSVWDFPRPRVIEKVRKPIMGNCQDKTTVFGVLHTSRNPENNKEEV